MEALTGSWQYENISSANEINSPSPLSPSLYAFGENYTLDPDFSYLDYGKDLTGFDDGNPFIGVGGESQLLSAANNASPVLFAPASQGNLNGCRNDLKTVDASALEEADDLSGLDIDLDSFLGLDTCSEDDLNEASVELGNQSMEIVGENGPQIEIPYISDDVAADTVEMASTEAVEAFQVHQFELAELVEQGAIVYSLSDYDGADDESTTGSAGIGSIHEMDEQDMNVELYFDDSISSSQDISAASSDAEDDAQESTLDALLRHDLVAAREHVNVIGTYQARKKAIASSSSSDPDYKPERRGRKPSSAVNAKTWTNVKDKAIRKKQQNKAAATKYRQKKKEEAECSMNIQNGLLQEFNKLAESKNKLAAEIASVKRLLREKLNIAKRV